MLVFLWISYILLLLVYFVARDWVMSERAKSQEDPTEAKGAASPAPSIAETKVLELNQLCLEKELSDTDKEQSAYRLITSSFNDVSSDDIQTFADEFIGGISLERIPVYVAEYTLIVTKLRRHDTPKRAEFLNQLEDHLLNEPDANREEVLDRLVGLR